jgi:cytochrome c-type biogenesis protein CcmH
MITFWIIALLLAVMASAFILIPVITNSRKGGGKASLEPSRSSINVAIFKERLAELEVKAREQEITAADFEMLKGELEQELLANVEPDQDLDTSSQQSVSLVLPVAFALLIPLFAFMIYADWGLSFGYINDVVIARELNAVNRQAAAQGGHTGEDMQAVVVRLKERLAAQPDNDEGWYMLARTLVNMGEYEEAAASFDRLVNRYPQDSTLLSYRAESLYMADARQITPRVQNAIDATLAVEPEAMNILEMLGMNAYANGQYAAAIGYFERVLAQDVSGERAEMLKQGISEAKSNLGEAPVAASQQVTMSPPIGKKQDEKQPATVAKHVINVLVEIEDGLNVAPGDTVFVFARAVQGPPMPLAVQRLTVANLPVLVRLDDTMSMVEGLNISTVGQVQVVARVSKSGKPTASPGDYQALSETLTVNDDLPVQKLRIAELVE